MFALFIIGLIVALIAIVYLFFAVFDDTSRPTSIWVTLALGLVCSLMLFFSCFRTVGTKEIGIPLTFGKVGTTHYGPGVHLTAPWTLIREMDGAIQTDDHLDKACFNVRIANQQTGCAEVSLQWRINPAYVDYDYKNYRSFDHLKTQLVDRKLFSAVNDTLASYNPLNTIAATTKKNPLPSYQNAIFRLMRQKVKDVNGRPLIEILNVQLPIVHFDAETQSRVNQLQQQVALTKIATQEKETNKAKAAANAALATKSLSEVVLVSRCLDDLESMVKSSQPVPAGFSCWPGGSGIGIIAPSTSK